MLLVSRRSNHALTHLICRCIQPDHLSVLALPVAEFLALLHNTSYLGYSQRSSQSAEHPFFAHSPRMPPPLVELDPSQDDDVRLIVCKRTTPLKDVLRLLSDNHVHRVYVVEAGAKQEVVSVITPTDILRAVTCKAGANPTAVPCSV